MYRSQFLTIGFVVLMTSCERGVGQSFLEGQHEVQYEVTEGYDDSKVYFVFHEDGTWTDHYMSRQDSLVQFAPSDVIDDHRFRFWGDSVYFWNYKWDVIEKDAEHMVVKMRGSARTWRMTKTNHPVAAKADELPKGIVLP